MQHQIWYQYIGVYNLPRLQHEKDCLVVKVISFKIHFLSSSNKFYNFVNRYVLPKPQEQQKIARKKFWGALLSFVCG
jgi:hypothetical protein